MAFVVGAYRTFESGIFRSTNFIIVPKRMLATMTARGIKKLSPSGTVIKCSPSYSFMRFPSHELQTTKPFAYKRYCYVSEIFKKV